MKTEVVLLAVTTAGGPTHGGAKMTGDRSPPQLCFSLSWQDSSSTAAALTFRSLCIGALQAAPVDASNEAAMAWRRTSEQARRVAICTDRRGGSAALSRPQASPPDNRWGCEMREWSAFAHVGGFAADEEVVARRREEIDHLGVFGEPPFVLRTSRNDHDVA